MPSQVQLWIRELRRLGRVVDQRPVFAWFDEPVQGRTCLPVFHCSECGESGWIALHAPGEDSKIQAQGVDGIQLDADPRKIYNAWFGYKNQHIVVIIPWPNDGGDAAPGEGKAARQEQFAFTADYLCPASLVLRKDDGPCPLTGDNRRFRVKVDRQTAKNRQDQVIGNQGCSNCGSKDAVMFAGSDPFFVFYSSLLNLTPDRLPLCPCLIELTKWRAGREMQCRSAATTAVRVLAESATMSPCGRARRRSTKAACASVRWPTGRSTSTRARASLSRSTWSIGTRR